MKKYSGTQYNSKWDASTWLIIGTVSASCLLPCLIDPSIWLVILCIGMLAFMLVTFLGIYYRIDGNEIVAYTFFIPTAYPIDRIQNIKSTKSILSAPATSLTHRIAITFTDRKVMKSSMPLVISPVCQEEFIAQLRSINPNIGCYEFLPS